jgi:hypothetical protein
VGKTNLRQVGELKVIVEKWCWPPAVDAFQNGVGRPRWMLFKVVLAIGGGWSKVVPQDDPLLRREKGR